MDLSTMILGAVLGLGSAFAFAFALGVMRHRRRSPADDQAAWAVAVSSLSTELTTNLANNLAANLAAERDQERQATIDAVIAIAGQKLGGQAQLASRELDLRGRAFDEKVAGMSEELHRVGQLVRTLQIEKAEQHGQFQQGLAEALRASATLTDTTQRLHEALSNSRARGQWGERMADDVLRTAGLIEGLNYTKQTTLAGGGRPDITFLLPRERLLHMDVKFPIDNYLRAHDAERDDDRDTLTKAFLRDVRGRIKELGTRDYIDADTTVGYVLLFIPNEAVYGFIHQVDVRLLDDALAQHVVLCSPCTLFAVLGVVRQAVDTFLLSRTSDEILECLNGFTKQWVAFSDKLDKLGMQFETVQRSYDDLAGTRRKQLQKQLDRVEVLRRAKQLDGLDGVDGVDGLEGIEVVDGLDDVEAELVLDDGRTGQDRSQLGLAVVERAS